jgi:5'-methylthioadenosine phosphorylase
VSKTPLLAVIGGSGLYNFPALKEIQSQEIDTPFGKPSAPIVTGTISGKPVAFLARHGSGHTISPTRVNYRANIYALKSLGVRQVVSVSACGSLREDYAPGHIVIPDQLFDFTHQRPRSFFDDSLVVHIGAADPLCKELSTQVFNAVIDAGGTAHAGGSFITIEGPRFSTKAESNTFRSWGMSIIGMTACPEAFLAREAEMCYATLAHVTDYDVWHVSEQAVSVEMVVRTLLKNTDLAQRAIQLLIEKLVEPEDCPCHHALADAIITHPAHIDPEAARRTALLVSKYIK